VWGGKERRKNQHAEQTTTEIRIEKTEKDEVKRKTRGRVKIQGNDKNIKRVQSKGKTTQSKDSKK